MDYTVSPSFQKRNAKRKADQIDSCMGGNIKRLRKEKKLTQSDIAKVLDVSLQQYQKYESGKNRLCARDFILLCDYFCVQQSVLIKQPQSALKDGAQMEYKTNAPELSPQEQMLKIFNGFSKTQQHAVINFLEVFMDS